MPAHQGCRLDEEVSETLALEQSCESRQHRSICGLGCWAVHLASKHRHFVAQHDDLDGEVGATATDELDELKHAAKRAVEEREGLYRMFAAPGSSRQSAAHSRWMAFSAPTRRRFVGGVAIGDVKAPAALAAARAAGQAVAVCHVGAHALGAPAYAAKAARLAAPDRAETLEDEIGWQLTHMPAEVRAALRSLPPVGDDRSGPLGPGLLASGELGAITRDIQAGLAQPGPD